jgi:sterol desaturase/sphingolipid hydroxylase (fatty acid hydroxylase superfamily)
MSIAVAPTQASTAERADRWADEARAAVSARVYLPACAIAVVAAVLIGFGWANHWGGNDFSAAMNSLRIEVAGPTAIVILGVLLVVERLRPAQRRSMFARGHRQDVLYALLHATLILPIVTALTLAFSVLVHRFAPWLILGRIGAAPRWGVIALIFVAMDGLNWLAHLANHKNRMLWRFHELHHSQEDMNALTVFRTHPLIHVSYLIALVPGVVLVSNGTLPTMLLVAYGGFVAFAHSNTNFGFGPLKWILVSPNFHRQHHRLDGPADVNLGFALSIWDQLSGRAVFPTTETIRTDTGLPGRPLIVEQAGDRPHHLSVFARQLVAPFRPMDRNDRTSMSPETYLERSDDMRQEVAARW